MKKKSLLIALVLTSIFLLCSCTKEKVVKPDTPLNTGLLLNHAIKSENYEAFNSLFSEGRKNCISEETFQNLIQATEGGSGGSGYTLYEVITLDNGEMFLVRLTPTETDGKYEVEDVTLLSGEMKEFFKDK